eukprot:398009_1
MEERRPVMRASKSGKSKNVHLNCDRSASLMGDNSTSGSSTVRPDGQTSPGPNALDNLSVGAISMGAFSIENVVVPAQSRRPKGNKFVQQRVQSWIMLLTPRLVTFFFIYITVLCFIVGVLLRNLAHDVHTTSIEYEGKYSSIEGCEVTNPGNSTTCNVTLVANAMMKPPIYVYYGLKNYYQNDRIYFASRDSDQLLGRKLNSHLCMNQNPCGLIANSTFNDTFNVSDVGDGSVVPDDYMVKTGIAWGFDKKKRFNQPRGFWAQECVDVDGVVDPADCGTCLVSSDSEPGCFTAEYQDTWYAVYYPEDDRITYLYEMFDFVNPVEGVENEHFMVWMRTAGKSHFKKIYGIINTTIMRGQALTFQVNARYFVKSFGGEKTLTLSTISPYGASNSCIWVSYMIVGTLGGVMALFFIIKDYFYRRGLADTRYLDLRGMM